MSEFECVNGHLMTGFVCKECGGRVYSEDGVTNRQARWEEKHPREEEPEDEGNDYHEEVQKEIE